MNRKLAGALSAAGIAGTALTACGTGAAAHAPVSAPRPAVIHTVTAPPKTAPKPPASHAPLAQAPASSQPCPFLP